MFWIIVTAIVCTYIGRRLSASKINIPQVIVHPIDGVLGYIRRGNDMGCSAYAIIVMDDGRVNSPVRVEVIPGNGRNLESFNVTGHAFERPSPDQVSRRIAMIIAQGHFKYLEEKR